MEIHNFLAIPKDKTMMETWHEMLVEAQKRKGERPQTSSRHELVKNYSCVREMKGGIKPEGLIATPDYPLCTTSLDKLTQVMVDDLRLETHHRASYILLRSIIPPDRNAAVFSVAEDERGSVLMFFLHNQTKDRAPDEILGVGTVFIVKEPYLKLTVGENYVLRVDHVTDLVYLSMEDPLMPAAWRQACHDDFANAMGMKDKGNEHFHKNKYYAAIDSYTKALDRNPTQEEICALKLNRFLALLKTSQLESALSDIDSILGVSKQTEKTLLRKYRILYEMQQYRSCCEALKLLLSQFLDNKPAKDKLNRAIERVAEQEKGRYRFEKMQAQTTKNRPPYLDNVTYVGPVSIQPAGPQGRGLFTTQEVKAGELLLVEKAFAYTYIDKNRETTSSL